MEPTNFHVSQKIKTIKKKGKTPFKGIQTLFDTMRTEIRKMEEEDGRGRGGGEEEALWL